MFELLIVYSIVFLCTGYAVWMLMPQAAKKILRHHGLKCLPQTWQAYLPRLSDKQGVCGHCDSGCSVPKKDGVHAIKWQKK